MKDERIIKELNKTKLVIFNYIFLITLLFVFTKILVFDIYIIYNYSIEIFIILMTFLLYIIKIFMFNQTNDERIEENFQKVGNILFTILFFGSFFIHFFIVAYFQSQDIIMYNITSTLILIGFIILVYQLRKRKIYFHFNFISKNKKDYLLIILKRISIFSLIFIINLIPYLIFKANILIGLITILLSILSLSVTYFIFSLYEKNHYDEEELLSIGKTRNLSKNVYLFYTIPLLYSVIFPVFSSVQTYFLINFEPYPYFEDVYVNLLFIRTILNIYYINIIVLTLITYIIIRKSIGRQLGRGSIYKLLTILMYSTLVINLINYLWNLLFPLVTRYVGGEYGSDAITNLVTTTSIIQLSFTLYSFVLLLLIIYRLFKERVYYLFYLLIYAISPIVSILINMWGLEQESQFLLILALILNLSANIAIYIFFIKHSQIIKTVDTEPNYI